MLTTIFRVFAALLGVLGALNIVLVVLSDAITNYSPVQLQAMSSLTDALLLFAVGAGIYVMSPGGHKSHH